MSVNLEYVFKIGFRVLIASYLISLGLNWQRFPTLFLSIANRNLSQYLTAEVFVMEEWHLKLYMHISVIIGTALLLGWRVGRYLGICVLAVNLFLFSELN